MPTRGNARKIGVRVEARPVASARQNGELARSASSTGTCTRMPLATWIALSGSSTPTCTCMAEDDLLARDEAQRGDEVAVARARDDPLVLPHGERVGARGADGQPLAGGLADLAAQRAQLLPASAVLRHGSVEISSTDSISSGLIVALGRVLEQRSRSR